MTMENLVYAVIAAVIGVMGTMITSLIRDRKTKGSKIDESEIKTSIEKIVTELNIDEAHFYILSDNRKFSTEKEMKFKFKSKGAELNSGNRAYIYQIKGRSGRVAVFIATSKTAEIKDRLSLVSKHF